MAADDIVGALTHHVAELEEQLAAMQADLEAEQSRLATYTESDRLLNDAAADGYRKADAILQRARAEANETLSGAVDERRMLLKEVERLREEREDLRDEIASFGRGGIVEDALPTQVEAPPARDLQSAIAKEMRTLLIEIVADFRSRVVTPPAVEVITMEPATAAEVVSAPPEEIRESIVEHVDELVEPAPRSRLVEHIDELPVSEGA